MAWKGWGLNYSFIYVGERYHNSANILANYEQPWYTHDLALSKIWKIRPKSRVSSAKSQVSDFKLHTTVEINNFLNQQYDIVHNYPMPGINGKLIVKVEI